MSAPAATRLMTAEEFLALPDDGIDRDLLYGVVREWGERITRRNRFHARVELRLGHLLESWLEKQPEPRGSALSGDAGCRLRQNADVVVGIDIVYISAALVAQQTDDWEIIVGTPTLAVEILSPSNSEEEINDKLAAYRDAGVPLVWLVDSYLQTVTVVRPDAPPQMYNVTQELTAEPHLPGFRIRVADIFVG